MTLFEPVSHRKELSGQATLIVLWVAVTGAAALLTPSPDGHGTHQQIGLPPCPSVLIFDRPCPGCGLTTSFTALIHGDFAGAMIAHPLGPVLYGLFSAVAFASLAGIVRGRRLRFEDAKLNRYGGIFILGFVAFGGLRFIASPGFATERENALVNRLSRSLQGEQRRDPAGVPKEHAPAKDPLARKGD